MDRLDSALGLQLARVGVHVVVDQVADRLQHRVGQRATHDEVAVGLELLGVGRGSRWQGCLRLPIYPASGTGAPVHGPVAPLPGR